MNSRDLTLSAIKGVPEKIPFNPFIMHLAATIADVDYCHEYVQKPEAYFFIATVNMGAYKR